MAHVSRVCCVVLLALALPVTALADGAVVTYRPLAGVEQQVEVGAQRAVVWATDSALELWIEPIHEWTSEEGVWIVPLPALPEVLVGDPAIFNDLDALTAPSFLDVCNMPDCDCECGIFFCFQMGSSESSSGGDDEAGLDGDAESLVHVWKSGAVGELAYHVVSSATGEGLGDWLEDKGYALPPALADAVRGHETEGVFFFVAEVSAPIVPGQSLTPVRFRLPPATEPFYPVRLTGASMQAGARLPVLLWVIGKKRLLPKNVPYARAQWAFYEAEKAAKGAWKKEVATYETMIIKHTTDHPGTMIVEYASRLNEARPWGGHQVIAEREGSDWGRVNSYDEGLYGRLQEVQLTSDLRARIETLGTPYVVRLRGKVPASLLIRDWTFAPDSQWPENLRENGGTIGVYWNDLGDCYECPIPCTPLFCSPIFPPKPLAAPVAMLVLLFASLLALVIRRTLFPIGGQRAASFILGQRDRR
jgi:Uncharacterized protein conserved in bacteria (DUF2330)